MRTLPKFSWLRRMLLSIIVVLNLGTVLYLNLPESAWQGIANSLDASFSPTTAYSLRRAEWSLHYYGHAVGLNNRWQMFGHQTRFNWWYVIRGVYGEDGTEELVLLPLPNQTPRTFAQSLFWDLKERKFALNIYQRPVARQGYSSYLARCYPEHAGQPLRAIRWELGTQEIVPPDRALETQQLVEQAMYLRPLDEFPVDHDPVTGRFTVGSSTLFPTGAEATL